MRFNQIQADIILNPKVSLVIVEPDIYEELCNNNWTYEIGRTDSTREIPALPRNKIKTYLRSYIFDEEENKVSENGKYIVV